MAGPVPAAAPPANRPVARTTGVPARGPLPGRGFDLPPLLYTTLAVGFGLFALGELLWLVVYVRDVDTLGMTAMGRIVTLLGALTGTAALVFGGCFGRALPGWARIVLVTVGAFLVVLGLGNDVFLGLAPQPDA